MNTHSHAGLPYASALLFLMTSLGVCGDAVQNVAAGSTPKQSQIDLDQSVQVALPSSIQDLKPVVFKTPDGKSGWTIRIPGGRPIATPAYADGMLFLGGGYGSHEFYAFNAETGDLIWKIPTGDDGPTAAVAEDGYVAFNTESCTVIVVVAKTGKVIWREWLGDPLMSQPAIYKGRLFIAYPGGQKKGGPAGHRLLAADLRTGKHLWEQSINGDVISAPVVANDVIYLTTFDGTSYALNVSDGSVIWKKSQSATAAPLVVNGQVVVTRREQNGKSINEGLARLDTAKGEQKDKELLGKTDAEYLAPQNGGGIAVNASAQAVMDSSVGFSAAPAAAKLSAAKGNLGIATVAGGWAYQGSRAAYSNGQLVNSQGHTLSSLRQKDGTQTWRADVKGKGVNETMQVFSPPAMGAKYMYLTSSMGHIVSLEQNNGTLHFAYSMKLPMAFQPALVHGNVYAGTTQGLLVCLKTGESDADGWYAWGGNAQHNK